MRKCVSCGDPIDSRRKDSKFCPKAKCRAKEYRKRQAEAAAVPTPRHDHQVSAVFGCPCGRKYLLQVSSLGAQQPGVVPMVAATIAASAPVTQTVLSLKQPPQEVAPRARPPVPDADANSSEQFAQGLPDTSTGVEVTGPVAATPTTMPVPQPAGAVADMEPTPTRQVSRPQLRTIELYFTDQNGRAVHFWNVVRKYGANRWRVMSFARPALGFGRLEGTGLGGIPGRWHDFYPLRDPSEFGHDADLAVLCWDEQEGRAYAAEVELLQAAWGDNWQAILREARDQRVGIQGR